MKENDSAIEANLLKSIEELSKRIGEYGDTDTSFALETAIEGLTRIRAFMPADEPVVVVFGGGIGGNERRATRAMDRLLEHRGPGVEP